MGGQVLRGDRVAGIDLSPIQDTGQRHEPAGGAILSRWAVQVRNHSSSSRRRSQALSDSFS